MSKTRFMTALFSATESGDEELTNQVAGDISAAKRNGSFEDDEMSYEDLGDEGVLATDKMNGEQTLIHNEVSEDGTDKWVELSAYPEYCVGDYVHPEINPDGSQVVYAADEVPVENPREFSVATDNQAVLRIFSDQDMVETVAESVYQSEQEAQVGDLKFEKSSDNDGIIVTSLSSGDKAMVELDGPDMRVTELDQKNFKSFSNRSNMNVISRRSFSDEQYEPIFVVALDPVNKVLVNSPVYGEAAAQELAGQLAELGLVGVNIFADPDEGRDYALALLCGEGVESTDQIGDEEEAEVAYSDQSVICNRYFTDRTRFMNRMFAEAEEEITDHQDIIEDAIENEEQIETEDYIITPVDEDTAVIEDKDSGEFTVAELDGEDINVEEISEEEAQDMIDEADEHEYSDYYDYYSRLYSEDLDSRMYSITPGGISYEIKNLKNLRNKKEYKGLSMKEIQAKYEAQLDNAAAAKEADRHSRRLTKSDRYIQEQKDIAKELKSRPYRKNAPVATNGAAYFGGDSKVAKKGNAVTEKASDLANWAKKNPKLAAGIGIGALAAAGAGAYYGLSQREESDTRMYSITPGGISYEISTLKDLRNKKEYKGLSMKEIQAKYEAQLDAEKAAEAADRHSRRLSKSDRYLKEQQDIAKEMKSRGYRTNAPVSTNGAAYFGNDSKVAKKGNAVTENVNKLTGWAKNNKKLAAGIGIGALALGAGGAYYGLRQKEESDTRMFDDATLAQIEDQATEAIQNVQEAAETAINAIQQAKNEPVDNSSDIQEATYSDRMFSDCKSLDEVW